MPSPATVSRTIVCKSPWLDSTGKLGIFKEIKIFPKVDNTYLGPIKGIHPVNQIQIRQLLTWRQMRSNSNKFYLKNQDK